MNRCVHDDIVPSFRERENTMSVISEREMKDNVMKHAYI